MPDRPLDLVRIRRAQLELDRIARQHPELTVQGQPWDASSVKDIMARTNAERQREYRNRKATSGFRRISFDASPETQAVLDALREQGGMTIDEAIQMALQRLGNDALTDREQPRE